MEDSLHIPKRKYLKKKKVIPRKIRFVRRFSTFPFSLTISLLTFPKYELLISEIKIYHSLLCIFFLMHNMCSLVFRGILFLFFFSLALKNIFLCLCSFSPLEIFFTPLLHFFCLINLLLMILKKKNSSFVDQPI